MSWALESAVRELQQELDAAGIEIRGNIMLTRDVAVRLAFHKDTSYYKKLLKAEITKVKDMRAAVIRARQTSLL